MGLPSIYLLRRIFEHVFEKRYTTRAIVVSYSKLLENTLSTINRWQHEKAETLSFHSVLGFAYLI